MLHPEEAGLIRSGKRPYGAQPGQPAQTVMIVFFSPENAEKRDVQFAGRQSRLDQEFDGSGAPGRLEPVEDGVEAGAR